MLVLLYGVSCVGKTSVIRKLQSKYNWKIIPTYMTREERTGEFEKKQIAAPELNKLEQGGFFLCVNHLPSGSYGTPIKEVEEAVTSKEEIWCLDFPISKKHLLSNHEHIGIILMPKDEKQLKEQIRKSDRLDRKDSILLDYRTNYQNVDENFYVIVNKPNEIDETAGFIQTIVFSKL